MALRIQKTYQYKLVEEKSEFISYIYPVESEEEFKRILNDLKKAHPKARHICYAYKIDCKEKFSDDGEPSGTAGKPIYSLIKLKNLNKVAIFVVRYFGGILLGSGRLLRTYSASAKGVIDKAELFEEVKEKEYLIEVDFSIFDKLKNYLQNMQFVIKKIDFNDKIIIDFFAPLKYEEDLESLYLNKLKIISIKEVINVRSIQK